MPRAWREARRRYMRGYPPQEIVQATPEQVIVALIEKARTEFAEQGIVLLPVQMPGGEIDATLIQVNSKMHSYDEWVAILARSYGVTVWQPNAPGPEDKP